MTVRILDPTVAPDPVATGLAPRLPDLDGLRLGLLANGKVNADRLLRLVADALPPRHRVAEVVTRVKANASQLAPGELLDELAARCHAVVTAVGD
jgi:hypothetical protein